METIGRNSACWCGSGKKYKKCHYQFDERLKEMAQEGHLIPSHDMIKTKNRLTESEKAAKSTLQFWIMWQSISDRV